MAQYDLNGKKVCIQSTYTTLKRYKGRRALYHRRHRPSLDGPLRATRCAHGPTDEHGEPSPHAQAPPKRARPHAARKHACARAPTYTVTCQCFHACRWYSDADGGCSFAEKFIRPGSPAARPNPPARARRTPSQPFAAVHALDHCHRWTWMTSSARGGVQPPAEARRARRFRTTSSRCSSRCW